MERSARAHVFFIELDTAAAWEVEPALTEPTAGAPGQDGWAPKKATPEADEALEDLLDGDAAALAEADPEALAALEQQLAQQSLDEALLDQTLQEAALQDALLQEAAASGAETALAHADQLQALADSQANQQTMAMMSQINQMSHETSMAIIDNMGDSGPDYNNNGYADWSE